MCFHVLISNISWKAFGLSSILKDFKLLFSLVFFSMNVDFGWSLIESYSNLVRSTTETLFWTECFSFKYFKLCIYLSLALRFLLQLILLFNSLNICKPILPTANKKFILIVNINSTVIIHAVERRIEDLMESLTSI